MDQQVNEEYTLKPYAVLPKDSINITKCINKIMNTLSFRKLAGKTQVILSLSGPDIRTRLTHTIEVARIARDICNDLGLNADLAEAISLAHDIGHTPFGHVGERTLREIMCGCDTLGGKVTDYDFGNSGFKHNFQSFRVLYNFEQLTNDNKKIWPYILWGAVAHSKLSWAKPESGLEDEILISSKHCDRVYVCNYHERKECKRNIQEKKKLELKAKGVEEKEICKPWFCARLSVVNNEKGVGKDDLKAGETKRDYIQKEYIKEKYQWNIYCSRKCYLAKLWKYRIENNYISIEHPYLFDHPFPNSFYSKSLHKYFYKTTNEYLSVEAIIVSQSDEIAQRQQDLEDGMNKGLLTFEEAKDQVECMMVKFKDEDHIKSLYSKIENIKKPDELGKLLIEFYNKLIVFGTIKNFLNFENDSKKEKINIFSLLNILYSMCPDSKTKSMYLDSKRISWIKSELNSIRHGCFSAKDIKDKLLSKYFEINCSRAYLYLLSYYYLDSWAKQGKYLNDSITILDTYLNCLELDINANNADDEKLKKKTQGDLHKLKNDFDSLKRDRKKCSKSKNIYKFLRILDRLNGCLKNLYKNEFKDYFINDKKEWWKNIGALNLHHFSVLNSIYENHFIKNADVFCAKDLTKVTIDKDQNIYEQKVELKNWKKRLGLEANRVINHLVQFIPEDDAAWKNKYNALADFEEKQKNIVLKSEAVEKNDGKASYILTRLFKAYITNSHQLPDTGLKYIIIALQDTTIWDELKKSENTTFKDILKKLEKTMVDSKDKITKITKITNANFIKIASPSKDNNFEVLKKGTSNEIKAALDNRRKLYKFFYKIEQNKDKISKWLNSEVDVDRKNLKIILRTFRANLDNPFLNPTPLWNSILTRGICDYIAGLTDQEALNEYEKLYAGIMELV